MRLNPTKVVVVDDHQLMVDAIRAALAGEDEFEIVGDAKSAEEGITLVDRRRPDLVLLDIRMPRMDGLECLRLIKARHPDIKVVIVSGLDDGAVVRRALAGGASAFVSKLVDPRDLAATLRQVVEGTVVSTAPAVSQADDHIALSEREREVLALISSGAATKQIALEVGLSEQGVKYHLSRLYGKLGVAGRTDAVRAAHGLGLVGDLPSPVRR